MSWFLVVYDRVHGQLQELMEFPSSEKGEAVATRLRKEIAAPANWEVVLLEAGSEAALRQTHARYFGAEGVEGLATAAIPERTQQG